jgi:phosphoserine phosphatase RsbU/P
MLEPSLSRCTQLQSCALWRILDTTRNLAAPLGVDEILQKTLTTALQVLNADRGSVFLFDPKSNELYIKVAAGLHEEGLGAGFETVADSASSPVIRFPVDKGIAGETAQQRRLINVPDCYADPRFNPDVDRQTGYRTRCLLSVPLLGIDEALVGVLQLLNKQTGNFDADDERIAMILGAHCAVVLQRAMLLDEYILKQKMARDLALAREIQQNALPKAMPELAGYEFAAWSQPTDETGGDIYDAVALGGDRIGFLMADASGHGIGPALSAAQFRAMFRMGLLLGAGLEELMAKINLQLNSDLPSGRFVTAFAGILDGPNHTIHYHSAGQAPLIHYHAAQDRVEWLEASALPSGMFTLAKAVAPVPLNMEPGDIFALVSDGFFEFSNGAEEPFGGERVADQLRSRHGDSVEEIRRSLCDAVYAFAGDARQADDMTVVLVRRII